ncbi:hypothetical protein CYY_010167 [Polysphondylium violaceum]|uniref:VPS9 domain-containing protein n=1 Tax=Polysphondylium violaceum TaxID=133409 RepID=A0A8J4UZZ2_9MYCE|nr:hypothetical protein CYY_010167 [Polysphondylium violaceum]
MENKGSPEISGIGGSHPALSSFLMDETVSDTSSNSSDYVQQQSQQAPTTQTLMLPPASIPPTTTAATTNSINMKGSLGGIGVIGGSLSVSQGSIINSKSSSSGNLMGGSSSYKDKDTGEKKPRTKLETMITSLEAGNMIFFGNSLKTKPIIPLTQILAQKNTFLHIACLSLRMVSVNFLLEKTTTQLVNCQNDKLKTPLYNCCEKGFFKAALSLLDYGASPLIANYQKWTPLHRLCSLEMKKNLYPYTPDSLIGYSPEAQLELAQKMFTVLEKSKVENSISNFIALKTNKGQTPLHISILSNNVDLSKYLLTHSTRESLKIKDDNGNTVLHLCSYRNNPKMINIAETILLTLSESLDGEAMQDYIDDINNLMATALQVSMKMANTTLNRLIVKYRAQAESKVLEEYFKSIESIDSSELLKISLETLAYNDDFKSTAFGKQFRRIVILIKQHYAINMSHQNSFVLLKRAKQTIRRYFDWLDSKIDHDHYEYLTVYREMLFTQIYDTIIHLYHETNKSKDLSFQQRVNMFKEISYKELDISEESWDQNVNILPKAMEILNSLPTKKTPAEKIETLNNATMQIQRNDANDLTPMFMYLLIKSQVNEIQSEFQFMDDFKDTPEQEQYLLLLQGSLDYLETLNYTLRNGHNQIMSLNSIRETTIDNILSLIDEFQYQASGADQVEDIDEGIQMTDQIILLQMLFTKLSNRTTNDPVYLPMKWSNPVMEAHHFKAVIERLGLKLDLKESSLIKNNSDNNSLQQSTTPSLECIQENNNCNSSPTTSPLLGGDSSPSLLSPSINNNHNNNNNLIPQCNINNNTSNEAPLVTRDSTNQSSSVATKEYPAGYICQKRGEVCVILEHPYPQMVYQIIEEKMRESVLPQMKNNKGKIN